MITNEFIRTVKIKSSELTKNTNVILLDKLNEICINVYWNGYFIKEILEIKARGPLKMAKNYYDGNFYCDVNFTAKCKTFEVGELFLFHVTSIQNECLYCEDTEKVAFLIMPLKDKPEIGLYVIGIVGQIYPNLTESPSIYTIPFPRPTEIQIIRVKDIDDGHHHAIQACADDIARVMSEAKLHPFYKEISAMFVSQTGKLVYEAFDLSTLDKFFKRTFTREDIYFIISPGHPHEDGVFYLAQNIRAIPDPQIRTESISVTALLLKHLSKLHNYCGVLCELVSKFQNKKEFDLNKIIWNHYAVHKG